MNSYEAFSNSIKGLYKSCLDYIIYQIESYSKLGLFKTTVRLPLLYDKEQLEVIKDILSKKYGYEILLITETDAYLLKISWMNSGTIISPDELGFVQDGKELYAGYITNSGCNKQWIIEYDDTFTLDENLQMLYEYIDEHYSSSEFSK